jgi:hypothetical protein
LRRGGHRPRCSITPSIQIRWLIILALGSGGCVDACPQAREAFLGLRSKVREHLPIASFDVGENFIDPRKNSPHNLDHLAPQGVDFDPQLLYIPRALLAATIKILLRHRTILFRPGIAQTGRASLTAGRCCRCS